MKCEILEDFSRFVWFGEMERSKSEKELMGRSDTVIPTNGNHKAIDYGKGIELDCLIRR